MRPVLLDMTGFASFREPAVVDFADADYFALVGPTGSGKSTVIDAMTFALYGSAPRWGRRNAISFALAPTSNRCTVRLVFDIGDTRYVVAREVRRTTQGVQQKSAILERLTDRHGTGQMDEDSEVIAGDLKEVNDTIEGLLGLSFEDFCQCVVLPQGQFADFLKATPKERQDILLKLLGANHYETIGKAASQRAGVAAERANQLQIQLGELLEATPQAEDEARNRQASLAALLQTVEKTLPEIVAAETAAVAAIESYRQLTAESELLKTVRTPDGVSALQAEVDRTDTEYQAASGAETAAEDADSLARAAQAAGPDRRTIELVVARHQEHELLTGRQLDVAGAAVLARGHESAAKALVDANEVAIAKARDGKDRAKEAHSQATSARRHLLDRHQQLTQISIPDGIADLGLRIRHARKAADEAGSGLEQAEAAELAAKQRLAAAPEGSRLKQALIDHDERARLAERLLTLQADQAKARTAVQAATAKVTTSREALAAAKSHLERARSTRTAAELRQHLVNGEECPVCAQQVLTLPPPLTISKGEEAAVTKAEKALELAQSRLSAAANAETVKNVEVTETSARISTLDTALEDQPSERADITRALDELEKLTTATAEASRAVADAHRAERLANRTVADLDRESARAVTELARAHSPLAALGAPELDHSDLLAAWADLTAWAAATIAQLDNEALPSSARELTVAANSLLDAEQSLDEQERELRSAQQAYTTAVKDAEQSGGEHRRLIARLAELDLALTGAPTAAEAKAQLTRCDELEAAMIQAAESLRKARTRWRDVENARNRLQRKVEAHRAQLREVRDTLVPLHAPQVDDTNIEGAWALLTAWAGQQATIHARLILEAADRSAVANADRDSRVGSLLAEMLVNDIELRDDNVAAANSLVAVALERARSLTESIVADRRKAATLTARIQAAVEEQQVAKLLADLLRSNKFPQWLAAAALDALVADASASLLELSGGQFDLTHDRGEFYVIDHADADSRRSVRTLSGGETFQASLALALALSAQLTTLAAQGAARLDSIFLDEGFGTLDPDTLEVVAETLENLAQGQRMVGVITHVAALAERAPVRFAIHRDSRTSSVVREGA